ncbi:hypothetical protein [Sphingomonas sp. Leaf242]|uniref:hypothetical protein n=1 Tax=Sphingomonas sp. Leaf242 TaxID=1736304 RepID=UPI000AE0F01C|nr:hypothetical protein [Sphingomonas sp. Leaf242]
MAQALALIFGESSNDTNALRHLIPALLPPEVIPLCRAVREPGTLSRNAAVPKRKAVAQAIAIVAKYEARSRTVAVVAHEDCDAIEDAHLGRMASIKAELSKAGVTHPIAAAPAWEMEAWWMLFPEALRAVRKCWAEVDFGGRNVGTITDAKEVLRRALRPSVGANKCPDYAESDSVRIAEEIGRLGLGRDDGRLKRSKSLTAFRDDLALAFARA